MDDSPVPPASLPPDIDVPPVGWGNFWAWYFGAVALIFAIVQALPAILPDNVQTWLKDNGLVFVLIVLMIVPLLVIVWRLVPVIRAKCKRDRNYTSLHTAALLIIDAESSKFDGLNASVETKIEERTEELEIIARDLEQRLERTATELAKAKKEIVVQWLQNKGAVRLRVRSQRFTRENLYITVEKPEIPILEVGKELIIRDVEDGMLMGYFEITEVRTDNYIAVGVDSIDELWLGEAMQSGATDIVPSMEALYIPEDENNEER